MNSWGFWTWMSDLFIIALIITGWCFVCPAMVQLWKAKNFKWFWAYSPFILSQIIILCSLLFDIIRHVRK